MQHDYQPHLATLELIVEVRRLLETERRTERLICRYLADLANRVREGLDNTLWDTAWSSAPPTIISSTTASELCFRDAEGHPLVAEGSLAELPARTDEAMTSRGGSSSHGAAARLLHAIGRRGGWSRDALIEKLDLPARVVASALQLELGGSTCPPITPSSCKRMLTSSPRPWATPRGRAARVLAAYTGFRPVSTPRNWRASWSMRFHEPFP